VILNVLVERELFSVLGLHHRDMWLIFIDPNRQREWHHCSCVVHCYGECRFNSRPGIICFLPELLWKYK